MTQNYLHLILKKVSNGYAASVLCIFVMFFTSIEVQAQEDDFSSATVTVTDATPPSVVVPNDTKLLTFNIEESN